jgi:multiple sugar transport system substrate-binding protein
VISRSIFKEEEQMRKRLGALTVSIIAGAALVALAGCTSGGGSADGGGDAKTLTLWDAWTQYDANSPYGKLLSACEKSTGIKITRTSDAKYTDNLLNAATSGNTPNLVVLDNPVIAQFAETGLLVDNSVTGLSTANTRPNVLAAAKLKGKVYGASMGSNTLALYYNTDMFAKAGLTPPTTWDELKSDAAKLTTGDVKGIGFSAINTEEGTFQFLPFFWGAGAKLTDIDSPQAVKALQLWTDLVKSGSASQANVNANQNDVNDQFKAGKLAMQVNGTWQLGGLNEAKVPYKVVPIPGADGKPAPSPLGGEFFEVVKSDAAHQKASGKFAQCVTNPDHLGAWAKGQNYILPTVKAGDAQAAADPALKPWVEAIAVAQGRTADLGAKYPDTSKAIYTAMQQALTGSASPADALKAAAATIK